MLNIENVFLTFAKRFADGALTVDSVAPVLVITLIGFAVLFIVLPFLLSVTIGHLLYAISFLRFTKNRTDLKRWLVWVPLANTPNAMYLIENLTEMEELRLFGGRITLNKKTAFTVFLVLWIVFFVLVGAKVPLLPSVAFVCIYLMEYAYIKNLLNYLMPERKDKNRKTLIFVMILNLFTYGFARPVYLFSLSKKVASRLTDDPMDSEDLWTSSVDEL